MSQLLPLQVDPDWRQAPIADLIDHITRRFHDRHREQLPELIVLSRQVEHRHAAREDCPAGLADALEALQQELESHMLKEEQVLFPMLTRGMVKQARGPVSVMRFEHEQHRNALNSIRRIARNFTAPADACKTWNALYAALGGFQEDLSQHIHLENEVLFANEAEGAHHG